MSTEKAATPVYCDECAISLDLHDGQGTCDSALEKARRRVMDADQVDPVPCRHCNGRGYRTWSGTGRRSAGGMTLSTMKCEACDGTGTDNT